MEELKQLIEKIDISLLQEQEIMEYLEQFNDLRIVDIDIDIDASSIQLICNKEKIEVLFITLTNAKWWSIYRYDRTETKFEQIDIVLYDDINSNKYDKVIKYSAHVEDKDYSYITCSGFSYLNNEVIRSWKKDRVVPLEDLKEIQYSKNMNLTELICMTDIKSDNLIRCSNQNDVKKLVLKIGKTDFN